MSEVKVGDVVQLKSGSPKMVVTVIEGWAGMVWCKFWNKKEYKFEQNLIHPDHLICISNIDNLTSHVVDPSNPYNVLDDIVIEIYRDCVLTVRDLIKDMIKK